MEDEKYTLSDGTVITDEVAEKIVEEVYDAIDRGAYKVITDKVRKTPTITIPNEEIKKKLLQEIQNA
ncbi:hypothetical protein AGMMS49942_12390 [Spirochaetia bacterium]|nr:hypothetical protein FACS1894137_14670 [Spirochaetia bacterium]GHU56754.1 hypothetical protein FACS189442_5530 [Spirochaetia bacterium]GHU62229.1 hypothetical protein FACS189445_5050 [Spirochaetia bacterium]GHV15068.1 hypothetical protein FACS189491_11930 [Spirochaetia bacterium]GHV76418.1 hypothetical protein AGMMS49942_12390 [Spirochaetia bacterium]